MFDMGHVLSAAEKVKFIRGRTKTSINVSFRGFRHSRDGKETVDGRQAWRCVKKKDRCTGRIYTRGDIFIIESKPHVHDPDFTDCEVKELLSESKDVAATTSTRPSEILSSLKRNASEAAQIHLPRKITLGSTASTT